MTDNETAKSRNENITTKLPHVLLVDVGNSRIKWQLSQLDSVSDLKQWGDELHPDQVIYHVDKTEQQLLEELVQKWQSLPEKPQHVFVASVSHDALVTKLEKVCLDIFSAEMVVVKSKQRCKEVSNGYLFAHRLGVDRWLGLLASHERYPDANVIVVSCGSAVTVDAMQADGQHLGGVIFPGIRLQQQSLFSGTANLAILAKLNADESTEVRTVLADHTKAAISGGTTYAVVGGIEKLVSTMHQGFNSEHRSDTTSKPTVCIFTGGDAQQVMQSISWDSLTDIESHLFANLVFEGLRIVAIEMLASAGSSDNGNDGNEKLNNTKAEVIGE